MLGDLHINVKSKGKKSVTKAKNGSNPGGGGVKIQPLSAEVIEM